MPLFGLIALIVSLGVGAWVWFGQPAPATAPTTDQPETPSYRDAIKTAKDAVHPQNTITVYDGVSVASNSTTLNLAGRGLTGSLRAEIRHLTQLTSLDISNNEFTGLPAEVGQLRELTVLNLSHNPLTGLPHELGQLSKLQTLDLRGTAYSTADLAIIKASLPATVEILMD